MAKFLESVGMLSIGACVAGGAFWLMTLSDDAVTVAAAPVMTPDVQTVADPVLTQDVAEVSRAMNTNVALGAADQIHALMSQTEDAMANEIELTPEQREVVAIFESTARTRNAEGSSSDGRVNFDNLTINDLNVRYYYSTAAHFDALDVQDLLAEQKLLVQDNICNQDSIRTLITEFDVSYTYRFLSADFRYIGEVNGDVTACPS